MIDISQSGPEASCPYPEFSWNTPGRGAQQRALASDDDDISLELELLERFRD